MEEYRVPNRHRRRKRMNRWKVVVITLFLFFVGALTLFYAADKMI